METIWKQRFENENEHIIVNQMREVAIIMLSMQMIYEGIYISVHRNDGVLVNSELSAYANMGLQEYLERMYYNAEKGVDNKVYVRFMRILRWLHIIQKKRGGIEIVYENSNNKENYCIKYNKNINGNITGILAAADILIDENEITNYFIATSPKYSAIFEIVSIILTSTRASMMDTEIFNIKYNNMYSLCITKTINWIGPKEGNLINTEKGQLFIVKLLVCNVESIAKDCQSCNTIRMCKYYKELLTQMIDDIPSNWNNYIVKFREIVPNKNICTVYRQFGACFMRQKYLKRIDVAIGKEKIVQHDGYYSMYCDDWNKKNIEEIGNSIVYTDKLTPCFELIAGDDDGNSGIGKSTLCNAYGAIFDSGISFEKKN